MLWSVWWVWLCFALVLGIVEALLPGFIFLGFALGALVVALMLLFGVTTTLPILVMIFAGLSLVAWLVLRRIFALPNGQVKVINRDIND